MVDREVREVEEAVAHAAYSQSTIQMRSPVVDEVRVQQVVVAGAERLVAARARSGRRSPSPPRTRAAPRSRAPAPWRGRPRRRGTSRSGRDRRAVVEAAERRAISPSVSGSRTSSGSTGLALDEARDQVALRLEEGDDLGREPEPAAARVASCSARRSIPSSSVSLPPIRSTNASPSDCRTLKLRFVIPPAERLERRTRPGQIRSAIASGCIGRAIPVEGARRRLAAC